MRLPNLPRWMYRPGSDLSGFKYVIQPSKRGRWYVELFEWREMQSSEWFKGGRPMDWVKLDYEYTEFKIGARWWAEKQILERRKSLLRKKRKQDSFTYYA